MALSRLGGISGSVKRFREFRPLFLREDARGWTLSENTRSRDLTLDPQQACWPVNEPPPSLHGSIRSRRTTRGWPGSRRCWDPGNAAVAGGTFCSRSSGDNSNNNNNRGRRLLGEKGVKLHRVVNFAKSFIPANS